MFSAKLVLPALALCAATLFSNPAAAATALTHTDVNLHSGPGSKFMTVGDVGANSKVGVLWCGGADFNWCLIQFHAKQGWVSLNDLTGFGTAGSKSEVGGTGRHAADVAAGGNPLKSAPAESPFPPQSHTSKAERIDPLNPLCLVAWLWSCKRAKLYRHPLRNLT